MIASYLPRSDKFNITGLTRNVILLYEYSDSSLQDKIDKIRNREKFNITGLTMSSLIRLYNNIPDQPFKKELYKTMLESLDDETIADEYGYSTAEYLSYALQTK